MKILMVHNFYGSEAPSGENQVFEAEKALLEKGGHAVVTFTRDSDDIRRQGVAGTIKGALAVAWNPFSAIALRSLVDKFKPDVIHVHNTFPLISPSIFVGIGSKAARVLTLHNYRLLCPAAIPMRGGSICTECIDKKTVLPAIKYGCYRNSRLATLPLAFNVALNRFLGTWRSEVDAFIVLSEFQKQLLVNGGLPASKLHIKPNFYAGRPTRVPWVERGNYVVFVGRLSSEKGVKALIKAWQDWGRIAPELRVIGDGPLRQALERQARGANVRFCGQVSAEDAEAQIAAAKLLVLPSECFEGFPMVVREAFAFGTPVAASKLGPLPDIVNHGANGLVFEAANPTSLLRIVSDAWKSEEMLQRLSEGARESFEKLYNEDSNYKSLMEIYQEAIMRNRSIQS